MSDEQPDFESAFGNPGRGMDMLPKPTSGKLPLLITGGSQQSPEWLANNGDGWMTYPRSTTAQAQAIRDWRQRIDDAGRPNQPVMQPLYIDLTEDSNTPPQPIHLGYRLGVNRLREYLSERQQIGVNHIALNLRFNQADIETTLRRLADEVLPDFGD